MQVHVLTHHAGLYGQGLVGVYATPLAARAAALNHARTRLAQGLRSTGAAELAWTRQPAGRWYAPVGDAACYTIDPQTVIETPPAIVEVETARIAHLAELVAEGHIGLDWCADADVPAISAALAAR